MKHCTNCQYTLPDNFIACPNCGTQLSEQPDPGSAPMQMFMYDEQMGKKIGTGNSMNHVLKILLISIFLFIIIIPLVVVLSNANMIAMAITLFIWFAVIAATVVCAFVISYKKSVARTAYIYYNGTLYKEILWAGQNLWIYVNGVKTGNEMMDLAGKAAIVANKYRILKDFEQKVLNPAPYLQLFARYSAGEKVWNSVTGGDGKIDALRNFRITGETERHYNYTYINEKGKLKSDKLLKCYPNIETIFSLCR